MDTDLITPLLRKSGAVERFALYYMLPFELDRLFPEVRVYTPAYCRQFRITADYYLNHLILGRLSFYDFLDFFVHVDKEYKIGILTFNGIIDTDDDDDIDLYMRLKDLGEEKVLTTLCTYKFLYGDTAYWRKTIERPIWLE